MPARTYLTTPAGTEPSEATGSGSEEPRERYVPGLSAAREPHVPSRWRTPLRVAIGVVVLVVVIVAVLRTSASQQAQDPSLFIPEQSDQPPAPPTAPGDDEPGGALPGEG